MRLLLRLIFLLGVMSFSLMSLANLNCDIKNPNCLFVLKVGKSLKINKLYVKALSQSVIRLQGEQLDVVSGKLYMLNKGDSSIKMHTSLGGFNVSKSNEFILELFKNKSSIEFTALSKKVNLRSLLVDEQMLSIVPFVTVEVMFDHNEKILKSVKSEALDVKSYVSALLRVYSNDQKVIKKLIDLSGPLLIKQSRKLASQSKAFVDESIKAFELRERLLKEKKIREKKEAEELKNWYLRKNYLNI